MVQKNCTLYLSGYRLPNMDVNVLTLCQNSVDEMCLSFVQNWWMKMYTHHGAHNYNNLPLLETLASLITLSHM